MPVNLYTFRIQRNTPRGDGNMQTRWQEYQLELEETATVLTALEEIKGHKDGTLTFRQSCRSAICGSCAMKISGRTRLACKTHISKVAEDGVIEIAPQANQPVLKDLAVDIGPFFEKVLKIKPYLEEGNESESNVGKTAFEQVNHVTQCIMCGSCYSDCTIAEVSSDFLGPAALAKAFRFVSDPREGRKTARLQDLSDPNGMWTCARCAMCVETCPKDVAPMEAIVKLRTRGVDKNFDEGPGQKHALAFHKDITSSGHLNEFTLMMRTVGIFGTLAELGAAWHLTKKGKVPSPFPHKSEGLRELKKMYEYIEANPMDVETKADERPPE